MTNLADWIRLLGGLFFVLAMIVIAAWALRRLQSRQAGPSASQKLLRVVGYHSLGMKEKLVVVEIQSTWLVLGMTPTGISTLHTLPRPETSGAEPSDDVPPSLQAAFATQLKRVISRDRE